jgi:hypothetical protein
MAEPPVKVRRTRAKRVVADAVNGTSSKPPAATPDEQAAPAPAKPTRARRTTKATPREGQVDL